MTTQTLKINTTIINNSDLKKRIFNILVFTGGALALGYMLLLSNMVWNIVARKNLETQARSLSTEVSSLELEYLSLSGKVDLNMAHSMGFKETSISYANRKSLGSLTLAPNEL